MRNEGFSLVEMVISIAIILTMAAVAAPMFRARFATRISSAPRSSSRRASASRTRSRCARASTRRSGSRASEAAA
jgi:prepilin-type N-terminal cleavage/methylation domain-containing protein